MDLGAQLFGDLAGGSAGVRFGNDPLVIVPRGGDCALQIVPNLLLPRTAP